MARQDEQEQHAAAPRNEVVLVGRVSGQAQERELPSGDLLVTFRLVVDRPPPPKGAVGRVVTVDTLDCACWGAGVRRTARGFASDDVVEVTGALRRRFWRAGPVPASRTEVEVGSLRRLARAPVVPEPAKRRRSAAAAEVPVVSAGQSS
ncbi:MAG: hypothetical protein JWN17_982 [Frankiales bacterium]|nr:hypothetical protein [Frankiales bacterium]